MQTKFWLENLKGRRPRCSWKDIRMDLIKIVWEGVDWIHLAQNRD
jgi:hypothetical protein